MKKNFEEDMAGGDLDIPGWVRWHAMEAIEEAKMKKVLVLVGITIMI
jgi:hypothetical protein